MTAQGPKVLIMAAGTGGHVFPALSIADCLLKRGAEVHWLATRSGMENELLGETTIPLHQISVSGLRGSGMRRKLMAPIMLSKALAQSLSVLRTLRPDCVLGMGGFVCGPAGIAAKVLRIPLFIHEQNAVAGLTNRLLHRISRRTFTGFPGVFAESARVEFAGNPLRADIAALHDQEKTDHDRYRPLRLLVLGGSQGATAINQVIPELIANWDGNKPEVIHQTGARNLEQTLNLYSSLGVEPGEKYQVKPFIGDMAASYAWADAVICRSGASTVSELAAAGLPAILVPYPHHKDEQQVHNGNWLVEAGAARLIRQEEFSARTVLPVLKLWDVDRDTLWKMREQALALAIVDAGDRIARRCLEVVDDNA